MKYCFDFSVENEKWVLEQVVDILESDELGYKLCIHHRDFVPGNTIMNNICIAIKHSRRFIAVYKVRTSVQQSTQ